MKGQRRHGWSVAELVPPILLGLVGLNILIAAPTKLAPSTTVPKTPRLIPPKTSPTNKPMLARFERGEPRPSFVSN